MPATAHNTILADSRPLTRVEVGPAPRALALFALTKPRLALFSIFSAMAAYVAVDSALGWTRLLVAFLGISLAAGGALSLNQWWERSLDARMRRTANRPLPRQALRPPTALFFSLALSGAGVGLLAVGVTLLSALVAAMIIILYGLIYTPLKQRTNWATEIGSISGALPPVLGAAAAGDPLNPVAWTLAMILLFWQMPHFYGIGWLHREDYRRAGFQLLPAIDETGGRTGQWSWIYSLLLLVLTPIPWALGWLGPVYGIPAILGGGWLLWRAWLFRCDHGDRRGTARKMFLAGVVYLPIILAIVVLDSWL